MLLQGRVVAVNMVKQKTLVRMVCMLVHTITRTCNDLTYPLTVIVFLTICRCKHNI